MSVLQIPKRSNPYPDLPRIYNLRARPLNSEEQIVFWDNPYRPDLVAYQFYACHTDNRTDSQPRERFCELPAQGIQWKPNQRYHGVVLRHGIDDPWNLCFFVRSVGSERHGQFVAIHLAGHYRMTIPLSTLREHYRAPVLEIAFGADRRDRRQAVTIQREWWAGDMVWTDVCSVEEAVHQHRGDSLIEREVNGDWEPIPAGLRKRKRIGHQRGNFLKHAMIPGTVEDVKNFDGSPCRFVPLEITQGP